MSRRIPPDLFAHLQGPVTSVCRLLRITLVTGEVYGITAHDRDIWYGGVRYVSANGFNASAIATNAGLSVDNSEVRVLGALDDSGITLEMAANGQLDDAQWELLLVNWADLSMGAAVLDAGDVGEVSVIDDIVYTPELLSFAMRLRQSIGTTWSRRCRAVFGSPAEGQLGCGVNASSMWVGGIVDGVQSDDPYRVFAYSGFSGLGAEFFPGRVLWKTGKNAGPRLRQVEAYSDSSGTVALFEPLAYPIEEGDTFEIRRDCNKSPSDCLAYGNFLNYKGEPYIPVGDGLETMTPSAQVFGGLSGSAIED